MIVNAAAAKQQQHLPKPEPQPGGLPGQLKLRFQCMGCQILAYRPATENAPIRQLEFEFRATTRILAFANPEIRQHWRKVPQELIRVPRLLFLQALVYDRKGTGELLRRSRALPPVEQARLQPAPVLRHMRTWQSQMFRNL